MTKYQRKKLDKLWAELVQLKAGNKCEYCGHTETLNSHHVYSRSNKSIRWSDANGVCLCAKHHALGRWSAHKAPIWFVEWIKKKRGEKWYDMLQYHARQITKLNYEAICTDLKFQLLEYQVKGIKCYLKNTG